MALLFSDLFISENILHPKQRSGYFLHLYLKTYYKLITIQLLEDCKKGKPLALRKLFESYSGYMIKVCLRYMKNTEDAEDMLSQGFSKVFQNLLKFEYKDEISLKAWIKKAMIFECLMHLRRQHNFIMVSDNEAEEAVYVDEIIEGLEANYIFIDCKFTYWISYRVEPLLYRRLQASRNC